ncbi:MAG: BCCT family transporter [Haloferacaceae archaeon]
MGLNDVSFVEGYLRRVLGPISLLSGVVVVSGFFFPELVGSVVSGRAWLLVALTFFGSVLGYLSVLPAHGEEPDDGSIVQYLLRLRVRLRRGKIVDAVTRFASRQEPVTFGAPVAVFVAFFLIVLSWPSGTATAVETVRTVLLVEFGWVFLGAMAVSVLYCLFLLFGPWGEIRLGGPDAEPGYTYPTYFSLVFTAGIAAGIVFWGPAEALFHYGTPPPTVDAAPESDAAVVGALTYALFHWGVSAWSAYAVIGVPIAYFVYQRGAPLRVSAILTPVLGVDNLDTAPGRLVDTLAVFATIGGIATSLALIIQQFLRGIQFQWGVASGGVDAVLFVGGLTVIYVLSAATGIDRGIRRIAGVTVALFAMFAAVLFAVGPSSFVVGQGEAALGSYAGNFVWMSLPAGGEWVGNWTVWNWSWWFSWAPFAGLFLAALSRGRRIRVVVFTGVVATAAASMAWHLLLGGTALRLQHAGEVDVLATIAAEGGSEAVAGFPVFAALPLSELLIFLFLALIVVFTTTSADTSTLVVAVLTTELGRAPTTGSVVFWGVFQGAVAVAVLLVGGEETLQAVAVLTGGPFALLAIVAIAGVSVTFYRDEGGRTSLVRAVIDRLPTISTHHDVEPPGKD